MSYGLSDCAFLFATERSGTHLLRSMLENTNLMSAPGELCNANADVVEHNELSFFEFKAKAISASPELKLPTPANQNNLLMSYFQFVRQSVGKPTRTLFDIKYSHIHNFNHFWWDFYSAPFLIEFAKAESIPIIHLVRKKIYETSLSELYAQSTGVWHAVSPDERVSKRIFVDMAMLDSKADAIFRTINLFARWLEGSRHIIIEYESLVGPDSLAALNSVIEFLNLEQVSQSTANSVKTTPPYEEVIENYSEISSRLLIELHTFEQNTPSRMA